MAAIVNQNLKSFLSNLQNAKDAETVVTKFDAFISNLYPEIDHIVIKQFRLHDKIDNVGRNEPGPEFYKSLSKFSAENRSHADIFFKSGDCYLFQIQDDLADLSYIFVFRKSSKVNIEVLSSYFQMLQDIIQLILNVSREIIKRQAEHHSNLLSQTLHDLNSFVKMLKSENENAVKTKIEYSERLIKEQLFYLQDLELTKSNLLVDELLQAIANNQEISQLKSLKINIDPALRESSINLDAELINIACTSIINNAQRATAHVGGMLIIEASKTDISTLFSRDTFLHICIKDDGPGIPDEFLSQVKKPYFTTHKPQGHPGFGLTNADKIVRAHKGKIEIKNLTPSGTQVSIYLPF